MNTQEILVYILVLAALIYTIYSIIKAFSGKNENSCGCSSCDFKTNTKDLKKSHKFISKVL